jgi:prepilin-type N-terminal cleavage/methylation domain-containing protein
MTARRGFTALELLMAATIGSVVLLAALGVFGMMERMDRFHAARFRESSDQVFAHTTLLRAMQTLVAKAEADAASVTREATGLDPEDENPEYDPGSSGPKDGNEGLRRAQAEAMKRQAERRDGPTGARTVDASGREIRQRPMFVLEPAGALGVSDQTAPRRLEVTMLAQPTPLAPRSAGFVRGAFEAVPRGRGWALVYRPMAPEGEPILLLDGIRDMRWEALVPGEGSGRRMLGASKDEGEAEKGGELVDQLFANVPRRFPKAVRFIAVLSTGQTVDWMFEPSVTTAGIYTGEDEGR